MKRFLLIGGCRQICHRNEINKDDLIAVKQHDIDWLIDTEKGLWFDAKANEWKLITDQGVPL